MRDRFDIDQVIKITGLGIHAEQAYGGADFDVACQIVVKKLWKIKEYESLEEQGKLLKLPVAVGDMVYYADNEYYFTVLPVKVDEIAIMESNEILYKCLLFDGNGDVETQFDFDKDDFGKIVFLTKESAEAALKELERGNG